jgi:16S rRNA (uracil1498-N3)-methyltransferase
MRKGETLTFTDGKGHLYEGIIRDDDPGGMTASVTSVSEDPSGRNYSLHVAISPLKNDDRLEWFIEKAVETGIDVITPLLCSRSEKKRIRRGRLEGIMLSAMKQSGRYLLPRLDEPVAISDFIGGLSAGRKLIATCDSSFDRISITEAFRRVKCHNSDRPEGDFTPDEVRAAIATGCLPVHLGTARLRTETAGIAACCSVFLANI